MRQPTLARTILLAALCLALAGCGVQELTVEAEHPCAESAYIEITNAGAGELRLAGWVIRDDLGDYDLPPARLAPGASLRVWRGAGRGDDANLYLAQPEPAWQLANRFDLSVERKTFWPWDSIQEYWLGCNVDLAP